MITPIKAKKTDSSISNVACNKRVFLSMLVYYILQEFTTPNVLSFNFMACSRVVI